MRLFSFLTIFCCFFCLNLRAEAVDNAEIFKKAETYTRKNGYKEPLYIGEKTKDIYTDQFNIFMLAKPDNFPFSSKEYGSIFNKIFRDLFDREHILITISSYSRDFSLVEEDFERRDYRDLESYRGLIGVYYREYKYSKNDFLYPSIMENNVHFIVPSDKDLDVKEKEDLKKYRGIYVKQDSFSDYVLSEFSRLNIKEVESWDEAFEKIMTSKVDFMVGTYYPSQIALYKVGLRPYVRYSVEPIWKMPMFIRLDAEMLNMPRIAQLKKYLKSNRYKSVRDEIFTKMLEGYKENTKGVVPPQYINSSATPQEGENN